jgi:quercetin dioxygenase-like cupin family protein
MADESFWFLNTLMTIRVPESAGEDRVSVIETRAPLGDSAPLHVHRTEDEIFVILEGEVRFQLGENRSLHGAGATVFTPKGVPHTYRVESKGGARFLTITVRGDFERFVRALSRKAETNQLPPPMTPSADAVALLKKVAAQHGIEIVGLPMS